MGGASRTLQAITDVAVELWCDDASQEQLDAYIDANPEKVKRAIGRYMESREETPVGWIDEDHEVFVIRAEDYFVTKVEQL